MSELFNRLFYLVNKEEIKISDHGYEELSEDRLSLRDVIRNFSSGVVVEEYLEYHKGPCVLLLQKDREGKPIHVLWGIEKGTESPAILVTAYRPDPERWSEDFLRRRTNEKTS